jgi:hypothetical protein
MFFSFDLRGAAPAVYRSGEMAPACAAQTNVPRAKNKRLLGWPSTGPGEA